MMQRYLALFGAAVLALIVVNGQFRDPEPAIWTVLGLTFLVWYVFLRGQGEIYDPAIAKRGAWLVAGAGVFGMLILSVGAPIEGALLWSGIAGFFAHLVVTPRQPHRGPSIERPDVLADAANVSAVASHVRATTEGVWCGEITVPQPPPEPPAARRLYVTAEDRGVVIGPPGTGKTAYMVTQLLDWAERGGSFVCLDIKPELHTILRERLEARGFRVLVFNPTAPKNRYNLLDDLAGLTAVGELAASLVPSEEGDTQAFAEGARDVIDGIVSYLRAEGRPVSLPAMRAFLAEFANEKELVRTLAESSDPNVREIAFALSRSGQNARFMGSVFATLRANLRFLRYDDIRASIRTSDFSLRVFLDDRPVALFLQFEERYQETTRLLLTAMVSHLFRFFIEHTERAPVLLALDEIGNAPRIPGLVEKLNTIRSRKLPTWLYWQGLQQMQKYGRHTDEGPNAILAACDFHMAFRLNDNDTAAWFSERIGTVDRHVTSYSYDPGDGFIEGLLSEHSRGPVTTENTSLVEEPIMKVADLQSLAVGEGIAIYRGRAWRNRATPYFERWPEMIRSKAARRVVDLAPG